jgi:HTH-type transcriptional regulator/antitoxin HigA
MEIKPIKTETEYRTALSEIERLFDVAEGTPEADRLEVLALLVESYEATHYPMPNPEPIDFLAICNLGLDSEDFRDQLGWNAQVGISVSCASF